MAFAELDDDGEVLAVVSEIPSPVEGEVPRRYLPVTSQYPEGYVPRFHQLLGPSVITVSQDQSVTTVTHPGANFSAQAKRDELVRQIKQEAHDLLQPSDWHIARSVETGSVIPEDVREYRTSVRRQALGFEVEILGLSENKLDEYIWIFTDVHRGRNAVLSAPRKAVANHLVLDRTGEVWDGAPPPEDNLPPRTSLIPQSPPTFNAEASDGLL